MILSLTNEGRTLTLNLLGIRIVFSGRGHIGSKIKYLIYTAVKLLFTSHDISYKQFETYLKDHPNALEKYSKLIHGLDDESIETVSLIVKRLGDCIRERSHKMKFIPSCKEKAQMSELDDNFYAQIIKLYDNAFVYKNYFLPKDHFEESVFYFKCGIDELSRGGLGGLKNRCIMDVGAYIGDSALVLAEYTDEKIYAFEPLKSNYDLMLETIKMNKLENKIILVNKGLGDKSEKLFINDNGSSSAFENAQNVEFGNIVETETLDDFVDRQNISVGLIKVDIEGFEQRFLRGALKTIKSQKPSLLISIYHNGEDFFEIKPMIESWNLGYKFKVRKYSSNSIVLETMLICEAL